LLKPAVAAAGASPGFAIPFVSNFGAGIEVGEGTESGKIEKDEYGGMKFLQLEATGYFRVENLQGRWTMVTPDGHPIYIIALNGVTPWYKDYMETSFETKYKKEFVSWARTSVERVDSLGFNTIAYKTAEQLLRQMMKGNVRKIPFTVLIPFVGKDDFPDVFSDSFQDSVARKAGKYCEPFKDEPYLVGYFLANELDLNLYENGRIDWRSRWIQALLKQAPGTPARKRFAELLEEKFGTIEKLKSKFPKADIEVSSFDEVGFDKIWPAFRKGNHDVVDILKTYNALLAEEFCKKTTEAIRQYDAKHLILGMRFVNDAEIEVLKSTKDYADIVSINKYPQGGKVPLSLYKKMHEYTGKPLFHTEFSFLEAGRDGSYPAASSQEMRGIYYKELVRNIVEVDQVVGYGWHEMYDPKAESNFGLYSIHDKLYTDAARNVIEGNRIVELRFAEIIMAKGEARRTPPS
jgi:agarase